jgi:hypothetical protein
MPRRPLAIHDPLERRLPSPGTVVAFSPVQMNNRNHVSEKGGQLDERERGCLAHLVSRKSDEPFDQ